MDDKRGYFEYKYGERIYMPEGITVIDCGSYEKYCNDEIENTLLRVYIPSSVRRIEPDAFSYKESLIAVSFDEFGSSLNYIGNDAFRGCSSLERFDFTKLGWLSMIGDRAFFGTGLKNVDLSHCSLDHVGWAAFASMENLSSVSWSVWGSSYPRAYTVPRNCFTDCKNLRSFCGDSCNNGHCLEYIGVDAFKGCDDVVEFKVTDNCMIGKGNESIEKFINN